MGNIFDGSELGIFDSMAADMVEAIGEEVNYYSLNKDTSKYDPLYGEYTSRGIDGPWKMPMLFKWPEQNPTSGEAGFSVDFAGQATVCRIHLEDRNAPYPIEGDVLEAWRTPYHDIDSMGKGSFDIVKVNNDGHLNDSPSFVQFILILKRNPNFAPERRLTPP